VVSKPYYSQHARSVCVSLSAFFITYVCIYIAEKEMHVTSCVELTFPVASIHHKLWDHSLFAEEYRGLESVIVSLHCSQTCVKRQLQQYISIP